MVSIFHSEANLNLDNSGHWGSTVLESMQNANMTDIPCSDQECLFCCIKYSFFAIYCLEIHHWDCWLDSKFMVIHDWNVLIKLGRDLKIIDLERVIIFYHDYVD